MPELKTFGKMSTHYTFELGKLPSGKTPKLVVTYPAHREAFLEAFS
jgi:hypothetical protein